MRIVQILPGSGGTFYCQNCIRDSALAKAMRDRGEDVVLLPMYLPLYTDTAGIDPGSPVFFGGVNVFLQQKFRWFRTAPLWLVKFLDSRPLLKLAARQAGATRAHGLGEMTLSMIRGEEGNQARELERLVQWLESLDGIDVLHLSSVLLIGLARRIKEALGVPIVCMLQDEDTWIDALDRPYDSACWDAMAEAAGDIDRFVAVSRYCADAMQQRLRLSSSKLGVVPIGIDISGYEAAPLSHEPPVIGYLSKMTPSVGLGDLVDAFIDLKRRPGMERLELRAMGGMVGADRRFIADLRRRLRRQGFANDVRFMPEVDRDSRLRFLRDVSVVSVPARGESFGLFMLEAWAAGVPVVLPRAGAFPELIGSTGGGIVYDVDAPGGLAEALASVVTNPAAAAAMGAAGKRAVEERFTAAHMAANMLKVYTEVRNRE